MNGVDAARERLAQLIQLGQCLLEQLPEVGTPTDPSGKIRAWQNDCATLVNELSGGTKSHWLARAFSGALLIRDTRGAAREDAPIADIVSRIVGVLDQARDSLARWQEAPTEANVAPAPHRFDFVRDARLRAILEAAYIDSRHALEAGQFADALATACSVLEAIVTDALAGVDQNRLASHGAQEGALSDWSFGTRLAVAERVGLIQGGCARLPAAARHYRERPDAAGQTSHEDVSERDARVTGQVLRIVMRDLDPGR